MPEIKKSVNIVVSETKEKLMQVLVQAKLPTSIAEMIVRELLQNVSLQAQQNLQKERVEYQKLLQEASKKINEEKAGNNNGNKGRTGK